MTPPGGSASERVKELFERWVERQVLDGVDPDPEELCRTSPELLPALRECIRDYQRLGRVLAPPEDPEAERQAVPALIGETVAHYRIVEKLGEGGMGLVYQAEDTRLGRTVALKFLPRNLTRDADARDRFLREAQTASSLDHPHICTIYGVDETEDGQLFIAMACYRGETLKERLVKGPLSLRDALVTATQVLEGLDAAHARGIVHRDLKPSNVLLAEGGGGAKILDFGLAKLTGRSGLTRTGVIVGTCAYMSPEQILRGDEVDQRSDLWSTGVVLYEMLTGRLPFPGGRQEVALHSILHESPEPIRSHRADVPEQLDRVVSRSLAKDAGDRYQSAGEMLGELRQLRSALDARDEQSTLIGSPLPLARRRRPRWLAPAIAAPLLLGGGLAIVLWQRAPEAGTSVRPEARPFFERALDYEERGDTQSSLELAEDMYRKALELDPENSTLKAHLAALLARLQAQYQVLGRKEESRELADQALAVNPDLALGWVARGRLSMLDGDHVAAEQAARRAVEAEPENHRGYSLLGRALFDQGRQDDGLRELGRAVEVGGDAVEPRVKLARGLEDAGDINQAAAVYEDVLKSAPDYPNALGGLANIYSRTGREEDAVRLYRQLFDLQPSDRAANNLGDELLRMDRLDEAIEAFQDASRLAPEKGAPLLGLGDAYLTRGDAKAAAIWYQQALEKYDRQLEAGGPKARLLAERGLCAAKLGRFDEAGENIAAALSLEATSSEVLFNAARVSVLAGRTEEAYDYMSRALGAGYQRQEFRRDINFRTLHDDPRFRALLEG